MSIYRTIARASVALFVAALLGAGAAGAQSLDGSGDEQQGLRALNEGPASCRAAGAPLSVERSSCYRRAANLANEQIPLPPPETRPIVIGGTSFDWTDAGVGFAAAAGLGLLGAGCALALRRRRVGALNE